MSGLNLNYPPYPAACDPAYPVNLLRAGTRFCDDPIFQRGEDFLENYYKSYVHLIRS